METLIKVRVLIRLEAGILSISLKSTRNPAGNLIFSNFSLFHVFFGITIFQICPVTSATGVILAQKGKETGERKKSIAIKLLITFHVQ